ncbi:hypothetical protein HWV62_8925 [Athelia sp. TMB]|nr:hypothetical protein HWV62_8925 [Athelia sp. TMB]
MAYGWVISVGVVSLVAWWICGALTSLLFLCRVFAVFKHSRAKKVVFTALWGLTGCATFSLLNTVAMPTLPPGVCQLYIDGFQPIIAVTSCPERSWLAMVLLVLVAAHNILVFISISHELLANSMLDGVSYMRTIITGNGLLPMSKSLLRSGQLYVGGSVGLVFATIFMYWEGGGYWMLWTGSIRRPSASSRAECFARCSSGSGAAV